MIKVDEAGIIIVYSIGAVRVIYIEKNNMRGWLFGNEQSALFINYYTGDLLLICIE